MNSSLTIGISSRSLFSLEKENEIFETKGIAEYVKYQLTHENEPLPPGTAFPLIKGLLNINRTLGTPMVNVIVISRNSPETGLRVFNSIESLELTIERGVFTGGASILPYLEAFKVDLFLSRNEEDVQAAIDHGIASAIILDPPADYNPDTDKIRIAFDADAVDYLLKPVDKEELHAAISKVCRMGQKIQNDEMRQLLDLMKRNNYRYRERFLLPYRDGYKSVLVKDINHISLEERNSCLFYNDGTSDVVPYTMDELEAQLDPRSFFRANRQFIIHIDHVKSISNYFNSRLCVHLKGFPDVTVNVSRERAAALKEWMDS